MKENEPQIITIITDLANISHVMNSYFKDEAKTTQWLNTENVLLEGATPTEMIFQGQTSRLIEHINGKYKT